MKVYERTENGTAAHVSRKDGLDEINHAQMDGRREVRTMSSISRTDYAIEYKDGRKVRLVLVDAPEQAPEDQPKETALDAWSVASPGTLLHLFTAADKTGRARCNKSYRPWRYGNGYSFRTKAEHRASEYAHLYKFCPRCEAKSAGN